MDTERIERMLQGIAVILLGIGITLIAGGGLGGTPFMLAGLWVVLRAPRKPM